MVMVTGNTIWYYLCTILLWAYDGDQENHGEEQNMWEEQGS
jgi:hypothetical protein